MVILALLTLLLYAGLMVYWRAYYPGLKHKNLKTLADQKFSVLVAFRDEQASIETLCQSLLQISYPRDQWEVIMIDDHSTDGSRDILERYASDLPLTLLTSPAEGKKAALAEGIAHAQHDRLYFTDADCRLPTELLESISTYAAEQPVVLGPVRLTSPTPSFFAYFQQSDFAMMQMATALSSEAGHIFLANGASLSYPLDAYRESAGYSSDTPSGDDILLIQSLRLDTTFCYKSEAIVETPVQPSLSSFITQRVRWASKSARYIGTFAQMVTLLFAWVNYFALFLAVLSLFDSQYFLVLGLYVLAKMAAEWLLLFPGLRFFSLGIKPLMIIAAQPLHILYMCFVPLRVLFGFSWKGRQY